MTRLSPSAVKISPPTTAPTIPRTISRKKPAPFLLTILAAMKPAISPSTIQAIMDTANPFFGGSDFVNTRAMRFQGAGNGAGLTRSDSAKDLPCRSSTLSRQIKTPAAASSIRLSKTAVASGAHMLVPDIAQVLLFITAFTMATVPLLSRLGGRLAPRLAPRCRWI